MVWTRSFTVDQFTVSHAKIEWREQTLKIQHVHLHMHIQGVSSNRRVFSAAIKRDFQIAVFSLVFFSNSGPDFANVVFGCFV